MNNFQRQIPPKPKLARSLSPPSSSSYMEVDEEFPSSSSSSSPSTWEHDVFLSFRGKDTRHSFTDHLYYALNQIGIDTFRDTEKLQRGKSISPELMKAIEESKFAVIVLSANYATSTWCVEELAHILDCKKRRGLEVLPVFYHVAPSEIRNQARELGEEIAKHGLDMIKVNRWREALNEVTTLSGWHVTKDRGESEVIQEIARGISRILNNMLSNPDTDLIGMDARIAQVESCLDLRSDDVLTVGIWGMGGIGKTTLAREVFKKIRNQFDTSGFVSNVRLHSEEKSLVELQKLLCGSFFGDSNININTVGRGIRLLKKVLHKKKVLIVLDDVADVNQLKDLTPGRQDEEDCWAPGSRLIITSRDRRTLTECGVIEHKIYEVEKMNDVEALQLICQHAFKRNNPPNEFVELSRSFVKYASGLPLAHKVLGSHLSGRIVDEWLEVLDRLDEDLDKDIFSVLQISFDGLHNTDKKIFLDIACFFNGEDHVRVQKILKGCGLSSGIGIANLINKSLIKIERKKLWMHDLLRCLGWHIVRRESDFPGKRSRLWLDDNAHKYEGRRSWRAEDTRNVLRQNSGTTNVEGLFLSLPEKEEIRVKNDPLLTMHNLRLLKICNVNFLDLHFTYLSKGLRLLEWHECPLESLSSWFTADEQVSLVELKMPNSRIQRLWNERISMKMLLLMDLSNCQYMTVTPDFSTVPNLEKLILEGCKKLSEVHHTIGDLQHLVLLNLKQCASLESLPQSISLRSLKTFILSGCLKLKKFPQYVENMASLSELFLDGTAIRELPVSIQHLEGLILLNLSCCKNLLSLPNFLCSSLTSLKFLYLSLCSSMDKLPENIGSLEHLEELDVCGTAVLKVPESISLLKNLKLLCFHGCSGQTSLQLPNLLSGLRNLISLNLGGCNLEQGAIPDDIGDLQSLQSLDLSENNFLSIPESISQLSELTEISLFKCNKLRSLPKALPCCLRQVDMRYCPMLTHYSYGWRKWASEKCLSIINCRKPEEDEDWPIMLHELRKFPLRNLIELNLSHCQHFTRVPELNEAPYIRRVILEGCVKLSEVDPTIGSLEHLVLWNLKGCVNLESLPRSISLKRLQILILSGCSKLKEFPEIKGNMDNLSQLYLDGTALRHLAIPMEHLNGLSLINLSGCRNLLTVPMFSSLKSLNLSGCSRVIRLPTDLGSMTQLEELDVSETGITGVPQSILSLEKLQVLSFCGCKGLQFSNWFSDLTSLTSLNLRRCGLAEKVIDSLYSLSSLHVLDLSENDLLSLPDEIGRLSSLDFLDLSENKFVSLPESICQLCELTELHLFRCSRLQSLPRKFPFSLRHLNTRDCPMLKNNADTLTIWASGKGFCLIYCSQSELDDNPPTHRPLFPKDRIELVFTKYIQDQIYGGKPFEFRFPHGTRIPQLWSHWRTGPSLSVQLSESNKGWMGLALFVVFEVLQMDNFDQSWEFQETICEFYSNLGHENSLVFQNFLNFTTGSYGLCCYEPQGGLYGSLFDKPVLQIIVSTKRPDLKVRGCGLHLISEQDAAEFVQSLVNQTATQHLDLNFHQHCEEILAKATTGDLVELDPDDLCEQGSTSTVNQDNCHISSSKVQLRAQLSILYEGRNGREKSFHVCLPEAVNLLPVPSWFFNHQAGDVTLCHISENLLEDQRWVGLELYVLFFCHKAASSNDHSFLFHVELCAHDNENLIMHQSLKRDSCLGASSHAVVLHLPRRHFQQQVNQCQGISALFTTSNPEMEVVVCGSRLVFQNDLKDLILSLIEAAGTSAEHVLAQLPSQIDTQTVGPVEEEMPIISFGKDLPIICISSFQSRSTAQVPEQNLTSIMRLKDCSSYLSQKQVLVESMPAPLVHSESEISVIAKGYLLEYRDSNLESVAKRDTYFHHVRIMAETQLYGSYSSQQLKVWLRWLLQHSQVATLSLGGHTISAFKNFNPSSTYHLICFSDMGVPEWFKHDMSYQMSSRSKVGIKLPPKLHEYDNWGGLAICATFEVHDVPETKSVVKLLCHLRAKDDYCLNAMPMYFITRKKLKSLHLRRFVWITYIPRDLLTDFNAVSDIEARIYVNSSALTVEKCGIRLLYQQEEMDFKNAVIDCWTPFFDNLLRIRQIVEADDRNVQPWKRHLFPDFKVFNPDIIYNDIHPCTEIPEWFGHHSKDVDWNIWWLRIQLPPSLSKENWKGLAVCASYPISIRFLDELNCFDFEFKLKTSNNGFISLHRYELTNEDSEFLKGHFRVSHDFIWLTYIPRRWFLHQLNNEPVLFATFAENCWKLNRVTHRFVYEHDVEELKQLCFNLLQRRAQL